MPLEKWESPSSSARPRLTVRLLIELDNLRSYITENAAQDNNARLDQTYLDDVALLASDIDAVLCHGRDNEYM